VQEEPDSVTMGSVPESSTPELKRRRSHDFGAETEPQKSSPVTTVPDDVVEHFTEQFVSPSQTSAAHLHNTSGDLGVRPAAESSLSEHENVHVAESSQRPDTASLKDTETDVAVSHSGRKKKKKRKRSPVFSDDAQDVRHTPAKEDGKHKHKDRSHGTKEVDQTHKAVDVGSTVTTKDVADDVSHSVREDKRAKSPDSKKHKEIADVVNSESANDKRAKKTESDAPKSDDGGPAKTGVGSKKVIRQYRHQDGIRERTCNKTSASRPKRSKASVSVLNQF